MNVNQITDKIKEIAISLETVNSVFEGDVYENWNSTEIKYGSFNVGLQNVSNDGNLCTYTFVFYYSDRLTQDKSNANSIYSDGVNTIQSVINVLNYMQFDISEQINYTPFEQKFMDYLAGVYATVNIVTSSSLGFCNMDDYNIEEIIEIVKNGVYDVTNYTKAVVNVIPKWGTIEGDINEQEDLIELIDGKINTLELPIATRNTLGGVIIGNGVNITDDGVLSCNIGGVSPITVSRGVNGFLVGVVKASKSHTGVVKIGDGLNVSNDGTISVPLPDLSNYLQQGSNNLTTNLVLYGKDYLSNVTVNNDNAGLSGKSLHKVSGTDEFDRGIFYKFTPDNIDFQNATTDVDGNIDSVTSQYKQTTKNIELNAEKVIVNPTSAFNVNGTMNVVATDKTTKFNNNKIEAKVKNTFTIKDGSDNKIFETKSSQTKINGRFDVTEPERGNILSLRKDAFETKVSGTSGVLNWQKMSAGGNPFAVGVENKSNINNGSKTAFLNALPDGDIYVYGVGGYDGLTTSGNKSLQTVINDLENGGGGGIVTKDAQIRVRINDCSTYENITVYVATSTGTYKQQITSMPSGDTVKDFDFDIQYTNANPLVTISVYSDTRTPSTIDYTGFWILYDYFSYEDVFNQDLSPIPLSFIPPSHNSYNHFNGNYAGFSFQINLTDYDINTDGRVQVCNVQTSTLCYAEDTLITLSDGTTKMVQDITYDDVLKVWNFDEGKSDSAKPIWIKVEQTANQYALVKLSDGNSIKLVGSDGKYHCMFDTDEQKFNHAIDCIGHNVYTENGITKVESLEIINEPVKFYNIVTNVHLNCYANHILTSTEKNNIYPINDMKFIKDNREFKPYETFEKYGITIDDYNGWRLSEQQMSVEECVEFIKQRKNTMKIKHI